MDHKLFCHARPRNCLIAYALLASAACGGSADAPSSAGTANTAAQSNGMTTSPGSAGGKPAAAADSSSTKAAATMATMATMTTMTATTPAAAGSGAKAPGQTGMTAAMGAAGAAAPSGTAGSTAPAKTMDTAAMAGAGAAAAAGGAAPATQSAGGFPRIGEEINIKAKGPYKVMYYDMGLMASEYSAAVMYYPVDATPPFAAVALSPGFTAYGTDYEFVGDMLASHGIAALLTTPTTTADLPPERGDDLVAAVKHLQEENSRDGSPLKGKIATDRLGITGHSMGGGGSLFGANALGTMIRCVVPMEPWQPGGAFPMIAAPTMIIGAASDTIAAVPANAQGHYSSIPETVEKFLVVFQGDHYLSTDRTSGIPQTDHAEANEHYDPQAAYMVPFYKLFLESDERYRPYLYGSERSMDQVTDYQKSKM